MRDVSENIRTEVAPSAGRNLSPGVAGTMTLDLISPRTLYRDRLNQADFRPARNFTIGQRLRLQARMDVDHLFNANPTPQIDDVFGAASHRRPQILPARLRSSASR